MSTSTWSTLIVQAEKLLGGPAPFINLSAILTSEAGFLATRARRLAATTDHPFFSTVRACLRGRRMPSLFAGQIKSSSMANSLISLDSSTQAKQSPSPRPSGGLIMLLLAQTCCNDITVITRAYRNTFSGQLKSLAELFETVHTATAIHKSLINSARLRDLDWSSSQTSTDSPPPSASTSDVDLNTWIDNLETGNKLATLAGDVLFASVSTTLASFHNAKIVELVSDGISSMIEAEFSPLLMHFTHGTSLDESACSEQFSGTSDWLNYVTSARGELLGTCCQAAFHLSSSFLGDSEIPNQETINKQSLLSSMAEVAKQFGQKWALLVRLVEERDIFQQVSADNNPLSVTTSHVADPFFKVHSPSGWLFQENGLPEPTLMDAHLLSRPEPRGSGGGPAVLESLGIYRTVGDQLADVLRSCWLQFKELSRQLRAEQQHTVANDNNILTSRSALLLLDQMIDHLITEAHALPQHTSP